MKTAGEFSVMRSTGGQLLTGAVVGGLGAELGGGNFWMGAATGLTVTAFNYLGNKMTVTAASSSESTSDDTKSSQNGNGDNVNWFDKTSEKDYALWDYANDDTTATNTVKIYSHGSDKGTINKISDTKIFSDKLSKSSPLWKQYIDSGKTMKLTLELKACFSCSFANRLVADGFKNLTIICKPPTDFYRVSYFISQRITWQPVQTWTKYINGYNFGNFNK